MLTFRIVSVGSAEPTVGSVAKMLRPSTKIKVPLRRCARQVRFGKFLRSIPPVGASLGGEAWGAPHSVGSGRRKAQINAHTLAKLIAIALVKFLLVIGNSLTQTVSY